MRRIASLTDMDILGLPGLSSAAPRVTARAIVVNPGDMLAVMYAEKYDIHTLPGGGVDAGESIEAALRRELNEETGCTITSVTPLGYVEENRAHADFTQLSYYYIVRTADDTLTPHLTQAELANRTRVLWCTPEEAYERIATPVTKRPQGRFLQARDMAALNAYRAWQAIRVLRVTADSPLRPRLADYAQRCSWAAGPHVAEMLRENRFTGWETAFAAMQGEEIIGYCTFLRTDYYPENRYWPWISSIFVGEAARGQGVCGLLLDAAIAYAKAQGFGTVYVPSDMTGFYERYGFDKIDELTNYGGDADSIFARHI
ncbi:MAG: GNAT family N-acetyltransferase [Clostridiales bacterium]|nr:GNAT family N-acetyltransferase [Clostridiales bacterium]